MIRLFFLFILLFCNCHCYDGIHLPKSKQNEKLISQKMKEWSNNISEKYHMSVLCADGLSTIIDGDDQVLWCTKFAMQGHKLTIDDMRPVAENVFYSLWKLIRVDKVFREYSLDFSRKVSYCKADVSIDHIGIRIDLWDENNDRYAYPYLSQVIVTGNKVYYFYADSNTQRLIKPGVEEDLPQWVIN